MLGLCCGGGGSYPRACCCCVLASALWRAIKLLAREYRFPGLRAFEASMFELRPADFYGASRSSGSRRSYVCVPECRVSMFRMGLVLGTTISFIGTVWI